jgi:heptosyltransferase-2
MNILIIHTAFIGDVVLSTSLIKKLKAKYPESRISYVTTPAGASILKNNPLLDEVIAYDKRGSHKGLKGLYFLGKRLKYKGYDLAIVPHRYLRSSVLAWLSDSKERIGYENAGGKIFLTKKIPYDKSLHEVEKLLSFVDLEWFEDKGLELYPGKAEKENIDRVWEKHALSGKRIVTVAAGSKWFTKRWPVEYFNELIEKLSQLENVAIILIGGHDELELNLAETDKTVNLINKTSLLDVAEIAKRSDIVVTNDSSPIHIASAFEKPYIFAIFGATVRELGFYPWSVNSEIIENEGLYCRPCGLHGGEKCPEGHFRCMLEIKPEFVFEKVKSKLEEIDSNRVKEH